MEKFNAQYPSVELKKFTKAHDRFLIMDDKDVYHFGASLKDLGKKWFVERFCEIPPVPRILAGMFFIGAFSKMDKTVFSLLENLKKLR